MDRLILGLTLGLVISLSVFPLTSPEIAQTRYEVTVRAAGALFTAQSGPNKGTTYAVEGIYVEKSQILGSFNQIVLYEWKDANNDGVAQETEFVPVELYVDSPQAAFILGLVFPGLVQPVAAGSIRFSVIGQERTIQLKHAGAILDLRVRSSMPSSSWPMSIQFVNTVTGWSFRVFGAEYEAEATGYAYLPGFLLGEIPVEPGAVKGFPGSGFLVPGATIHLSNVEG